MQYYAFIKIGELSKTHLTVVTSQTPQITFGVTNGGSVPHDKIVVILPGSQCIHEWTAHPILRCPHSTQTHPLQWYPTEPPSMLGQLFTLYLSLTLGWIVITSTTRVLFPVYCTSSRHLACPVEVHSNPSLLPTSPVTPDSNPMLTSTI